MADNSPQINYWQVENLLGEPHDVILRRASNSLSAEHPSYELRVFHQYGSGSIHLNERQVEQLLGRKP
jgi:hypothetical protein